MSDDRCRRAVDGHVSEARKPRVFSRLVEYLAGRGRLEAILAEGDPAKEAAFNAKCAELQAQDERDPLT